MIDVGTAVGYLMLDTSGFQSGFQSALSDLRTFQNETTSVSDKFSAVGTAMSSVGTTMTKSVTLPLVGLGATVATVAANFETSMSKVAAIAGLDTLGSEFEALSNKAKEMGATTKFSASEAADAFTYMAMAGWKTQDMLDGIDGIMNLAAASGEDLALTSDIVTDALTAFGLSAGDSAAFADILAAASNNANTNVSMLGESFKYVAPVAGALGYSAEDTSIALGLMANSGIKASQAGTALRTAMSNLVKPTDAMAGVMDEYGISLTDADGNMKSFMTIMTELRENMGGLDEATQAAAASTLFGKEAMSGMLAIINASDEDFNKLTEAIYNADGTALRMAETMQDNLSGQLTILKSALEGLAISFGELLIPYLTQFVQWLTGVVDKFNSMDEDTKKLIVTIAGIAAVVGPILTVLGKVVSAVGTVIKVITTIGGAISKLGGIASTVLGGLKAAVTGLFALIQAHPVVAVITAIIAVLLLLWNHCEGFRDAVKGIWDAICGFFKSAAEAIVSFFQGLPEFFAGLWEGIKQAFTGVVEFFSELFQGAIEAIQTLWSGLVEFFTNLWEGIKEVFSSALEFLSGLFSSAIEGIKSLWSTLGEFFSGLWEGIKTIFTRVVEFLNSLWQAHLEQMRQLWSTLTEFFTTLWEGIKAVFSAVAEFFQSIFQAAWDNIQAIWSVVVDWFSSVWEGIRQGAQALVDNLREFFTSCWEAIKAVWDTVVAFFTSVGDGIREVFSTVTQAIQGFFQEASDAVREIWSSIVEFFQKVWSDIQAAFDGVKEFFSKTFSAAVEAIKSAWSGIKGFFSGIWSDICGVFSNVGSKFREIGSNIVEAMKNGISGAWNSLVRWVSGLIDDVVDSVTGWITGGSKSRKSRGSYASGLDYVPVDGVYSLHEGEAILTKEENARRSTSGGDTFNFYSPKALDAVSAAREMKKAKQQLAQGFI